MSDQISDFPDPLVPAYVDLRSFAKMDLDVGRMVKSRAAITLPAEAFRCWFLLICQSWHQIPAASLPDDDRELAYLAGMGRDTDGWKVLRDDSLYGWRLCSDGRWYHPVTAEAALEAWNHKLRARHYRIPSKIRPPFEKWRKDHEKELAAHGKAIATLPRDYRGINPKPSRNVTRPDRGLDLTEDLTLPDMNKEGEGGGGATADTHALPPDEILALGIWNEVAAKTGLRKAQRLTEDRRVKLLQCIEVAGGLAGFRAACERAGKSERLRGVKPDSYAASLSQILKPEFFLQLIEGDFDDSPPARREQDGAPKTPSELRKRSERYRETAAFYRRTQPHREREIEKAEEEALRLESEADRMETTGDTT